VINQLRYFGAYISKQPTFKASNAAPAMFLAQQQSNLLLIPATFLFSLPHCSLSHSQIAQTHVTHPSLHREPAALITHLIIALHLHIQGVSKLNGKTSGTDSSYREEKKCMTTWVRKCIITELSERVIFIISGHKSPCNYPIVSLTEVRN
jgi:hypothetical protein